jgi:hypothetical protein
VIVPWHTAFGDAVADRISMGKRVPHNITGVPTAALAQRPPAATE